MNYLCDTSAVLRINDPDSSAHLETVDALNKLRQRGEILIIFPQVLVEFWVVATRRPKAVNGLGFSTKRAETELRDLQNIFTVLPESERIFEEWQKLIVKYKVSGKPAHDARIAAAMLVHEIKKIVTLNLSDFKRYKEIWAITPQEVLA